MNTQCANSSLDDIIEKVNSKGSHDELWHVLNSTHFLGHDAPRRIKEWANKNGMVVFFDYNGGDPLDLSIQSVSFCRIRLAN